MSSLVLLQRERDWGIYTSARNNGNQAEKIIPSSLGVAMPDDEPMIYKELVSRLKRYINAFFGARRMPKPAKRMIFQGFDKTIDVVFANKTWFGCQNPLEGEILRR